jgi:hypothetical protein
MLSCFNLLYGVARWRVTKNYMENQGMTVNGFKLRKTAVRG